MKPVLKTLVGALALATVIATSASAQSFSTPTGGRYNQSATTQTHDALVRGKVVGRDPDPFIRSQIERGYGLMGSQD
jgi:hypothetical protein